MDSIASLRRTTGAVYCQDCGKCTARCPLADGSFSPRRITMHEPGQGTTEAGDDIGRCLTCGSCEVRCPQGVQFTDYVRGLREGVGPDSGGPCPHKGIFQSIARGMTAQAPQRGLEWLGDGLRTAEKGEVALFVGCAPFFDEYFGASLGVATLESARSAVRILNRLGIEPVLAADERCCGHDLLWGGDAEAFDALAAANAETYRERGVKRILTTCAECCRTWTLDYPERMRGYAPKVQHFSEFLAEELDKGSVRFEADGSVKLTFQDPCRLGRHLGVVDAPRRVLDALPGAERLEMEHAGADASCCGTSGFQHCDSVSKRMQSERLDEALSTGATTLVTACPKCLIHFACSQTEDRRNDRGRQDMELIDFTVLAASRLQEDRPAEKGRETGET